MVGGDRPDERSVRRSLTGDGGLHRVRCRGDRVADPCRERGIRCARNRFGSARPCRVRCLRVRSGPCLRRDRCGAIRFGHSGGVADPGADVRTRSRGSSTGTAAGGGGLPVARPATATERRRPRHALHDRSVSDGTGCGIHAVHSATAGIRWVDAPVRAPAHRFHLYTNAIRQPVEAARPASGEIGRLVTGVGRALDTDRHACSGILCTPSTTDAAATPPRSRRDRRAVQRRRAGGGRDLRCRA